MVCQKYLQILCVILVTGLVRGQSTTEPGTSAGVTYAPATNLVTGAPTTVLSTDAATLPPTTDAATLPPITNAATLPPITDAATLPPITDAPTLPPFTELSTEGIILTCNATHMIVEIPKKLLTAGMTGEDVRFENESSSDCIGKDKGDDTGDGFIELTTSLTACGTVMAESPDTETYKNRVTNSDEEGISRNYVVDIPLTCTYNRSHRVGSSGSVSYQLTDYIIDKTLDEDGAYTFSFDIYTDENYNLVVPDYPFNIGLDEKLYFAASVVSTDDSLDLSIQSCRATPGTNYNSEPTFLFIEEGCPVEDADAEFEDLEDDNRVGVMLKTLRFVEDDTDLVYIHCNLLVCDATKDACDMNCDSSSSDIMERKRRDVSSELKTKRFTRGPLRVVRSAQRQGSVLSKDVSENGAATQQEVTNAFNPWIVAMAAMATVVMAMAAMMAVVLRKVNKISTAPAGYKEGSARLLDEKEEI